MSWYLSKDENKIVVSHHISWSKDEGFLSK